MSIYRCNSCEGYFDCDWVGCEADPSDDCGLLCLDCYDELDRMDLEDKLEFLIKDGE